MFRDLKEYQEIAKIYAEKVSRPENLEERVKGGGVSSNPVKPFQKPNPQVSGQRGNRPEVKGGITFKKPTPSASNKRAEMSKRRREIQNKPVPSTDQIRKDNPKVVPGTRVNEIGAKGGGKPSSGDLSMFKDKKPEVSTMTKRGKPRTKAQMMAAKRIASGKTIQQVKDENKASMRAKAKERFAAFKAKRAEKKAAMSEGIVDKGMDNLKKNIKIVAQGIGGAGKKIKNTAVKVAKEVKKGYDAQEEYTPYDIVLEYLLSTEQVATIEEANYVMTEMDGETIRSVVKEFLGGEKGDGYIGHPRLKFENPFSPPKKEKKKTESGKGLFKSLGNRATDIENMLK